ncbi:MAG: BamA/TamA family outer membrane protein [Verrucomicrobia bacterium]|nr:BamA/TamA family outer membrane protein [Verrucomicrobiota bacterium]
MKRKLLKLSPLAALLVAAHYLADAQESLPPDAKPATTEAKGDGQEPVVADEPAKTDVKKPEAAEKAPAPETQPVPPAEPALPNLLPDPIDPSKPRPIPPVPAKKVPGANAGDQVIDRPFTRSLNPDGTEGTQNLAGISLFADKRNVVKPDDVKALQWERAQKDVLKPGVQVMEGLHTPDPEGLRAALGHYISAGKPATFRDLQDMVGIIQEHYRKHHRPMTHVYIPRQSIHSDKVVISIVEGRVGETRILTEADLRSKPAAQLTDPEKSFLKRMDENKNWWNSWYNNPYKAKDVSDEFLPRTAQLKGRIVDTEEIQAQIAAMNRSPWVRLNRPIEHPFREVTVNFSQPEANVVGETNLNFEVDDQRPLKFFTGIDNSLTEATGENRVFLGAAWYDAFGLGKNHQMGLQFFSALDTSELAGVSLSYQIPWQDRKFEQFTELFAAYADSTTSLDFGGIPTDVGGTSFLIGGRHYLELPEMLGASDISQPLGTKNDKTWAKPIREALGLHHEVGLGLDFKQMDNTLQFGGTSVADSPADIFQVVLEYNARQTDPTGETFLGSQLFISPGDVTADNSDEAFSPLRRDAEAAYVYTRIRLEREQDLPFSGFFSGMMLKGALTGQYSSVNLLASEQLGLGGYSSVRGYPERVLRGDLGYIFNLELYSPEFHPAKEWFKFVKEDNLKFLAFFDYAHGEAVKDSVSDPLDDPADLMSVGVGLRYDFNDMLRLRFDYGVRLEDLPAAADNTDGGAFHFGLVCIF